MALEQLIKSIGEVNSERNYWFIRTDRGNYYDTFLESGYIGIGWNYITVENLVKLEANSIKDKIAVAQKYNLDSSRGKGKATSVYNKLMRFNDLKAGDVVLIPSRDSYRLGFGIIEDEHIYTDPENRDICPYHKRRKVKWIAQKRTIELDPIFYMIKQSRHAISSIDKYQNHIDNILNSLYIKHGYGHYVLDITTTDDINFNSLLSMVSGIQELLGEINSHFELNEDTSNSSIKLNLQSPGKIEFKLESGKTLIILAALLSFTSCGNPGEIPIKKAEIEGLSEFAEVHQAAIDSTQTAFNELKVDRDKINAIH
jgi:restriction system protein